jgi:hypothetical protein
MDAWVVFIKDHHQGYVEWSEYERNQALLAATPTVASVTRSPQ